MPLVCVLNDFLSDRFFSLFFWTVVIWFSDYFRVHSPCHLPSFFLIEIRISLRERLNFIEKNPYLKVDLEYKNFPRCKIIKQSLLNFARLFLCLRYIPDIFLTRCEKSSIKFDVSRLSVMYLCVLVSFFLSLSQTSLSLPSIGNIPPFPLVE